MNLGLLHWGLVGHAQSMWGKPELALSLMRRLELQAVEETTARGTLMIATADAPTTLKPYKFYYDSATDDLIITDLTGTPADVGEPTPRWAGRILSYEGHTWYFRAQRDSLLLAVLDMFQAAGWPGFVVVDAAEGRIREVVKYLNKRTKGVLRWSASFDQVRWIADLASNDHPRP
jgi:hypothetical protein